MSTPFVETPSVLVTDDLVATLVARGGYTHPLFNPAPGDGAARPLPGQAVLLLMGGLAEQSGELDHVIALLELRSVRFRAMVEAGSTLRVRISEGERTATSKPDRCVQHYTWTAVDDAGTTIAEAEAVMLVRATVAATASNQQEGEPS